MLASLCANQETAVVPVVADDASPTDGQGAHLRSQFLDRIAKSKEGMGNASEQETIDRQNMLEANSQIIG